MLTLLAQSKDAPRSAKSLRTAKSSLHFTAKKSKVQCSLIIKHLIIQGSYRQACVRFKDFSRTSKILSYCFQRLKMHEKILIFTLKFYFGNAGLHY